MLVTWVVEAALVSGRALLRRALFRILGWGHQLSCRLDRFTVRGTRAAKATAGRLWPTTMLSYQLSHISTSYVTSHFNYRRVNSVFPGCHAGALRTPAASSAASSLTASRPACGSAASSSRLTNAEPTITPSAKPATSAA